MDTGCEAPAEITVETERAPKGILWAVLASVIAAARRAGLDDCIQRYHAPEHASQSKMSAAPAGYEAPAQFAEETRAAARTVPWAIVMSVIATALCGGLHIASLLFSVQVG